MATRDCICSSVTLKIFWVIHGAETDKRRRTLKRHAQCNYCSREYKDIPERQMERERRALAKSLEGFVPNLRERYPFLKRYKKRATSA